MVVTNKGCAGFSAAQYEVINTLSCLNRDDDIVALKHLLVQFVNARLQNELDGLYEDGTLSDEKIESLASSHPRTPYKAS